MGEFFFDKFMFCFEKRNIIHISYSVWCTFTMNAIKKVFTMFISEKFVQKPKIFEPSERL